ncbi:MAG: universal stress protein [Desulfovibrionales bacterium]
MYTHILLPIDLQERDHRPMETAVHAAVDLCRLYGAQLHVLTVVPDLGMPSVGQYFPPEAEERIVHDAEHNLHDLVNQLIPEDIEVQHLVAQGTVYRRILHMAEKVGADLIIMPAHRTRFADYLLGSNASKVVRHAKCSVHVLRISIQCKE